MWRITELLSSISKCDQQSLNNLYDVFRSVNDYDLPIIRFTLISGSSLIRQRINEKGKVFKHISELSYPPVTLVSMNRANIPGPPMFYACKFPKQISYDAPIPRKISLLETSKFVKEETKVE